LLARRLAGSLLPAVPACHLVVARHALTSTVCR
jgi:hypothetical protein